jgi:hypothetical protein
MSKPKPSLLEPDTIKALKAASLSPLIIEFFGTVSGMARALNNSQNPVAAADTMLNRPKKPGNKYSTAEMFQMFIARKRKKHGATVTVPDDIQEIHDDYLKATRNNNDEDFKPEEFHAGHRQPDNATDE